MLDRQAPADGPPPLPRARLLGRFGLLGGVSAPLPGITKGIVDERAEAQMPYTELLPRYYSEVVAALREGQEDRVFRADAEATEMADFVLDSLALAYAVHRENPTPVIASLPGLLIDGLAARG
jgi:hypothetical protein